VALGGYDDRRVSHAGIGPVARAGTRDVSVIGLENDVPRVAGVADDHGNPALLALHMRSTVRVGACATGPNIQYGSHAANVRIHAPLRR